MWIVFIFLLLAGGIYLLTEVNFMAKNVGRIIALIVALTSVCSYLLKLTREELHYNEISYAYIGYIAVFAFAIWYARQASKQPPLEIIAQRQRYWEEVSDKDIYAAYANRRVLKSDRVEAVGVNKFENKLVSINENYTEFVSPQFFLNLDKVGKSLHKISSPDELEKSRVYRAIFKRLKSIVKEKELNIDYYKLLEENQGYAEYFLMDLWDTHTKDTNIGVANLNIICDEWIEEELVYALDILNLNNVKLKGASLYYAYMSFKGRNEPQDNKLNVGAEVLQNDEDPYF